MPRNADVMAICTALEQRLLAEARVTKPVTSVTSKQPKRDRAAYMRKYRACKKASNASPITKPTKQAYFAGQKA